MKSEYVEDNNNIPQNSMRRIFGEKKYILLFLRKKVVNISEEADEKEI